MKFCDLTKRLFKQVVKDEDINNAIDRALKSKGMEFSLNENTQEHTDYHFMFNQNNGQFHCVVDCRKNDKLIVIYLLFPENIPLNKFQAVSEFIVRANTGEPIVCFDLNMDDGSLCVRSGFKYDETSTLFGKNLLIHLFCAINFIDVYTPGIWAIINSQEDPKTIYNRIRNIVDVSLN